MTIWQTDEACVEAREKLWWAMRDWVHDGTPANITLPQFDEYARVVAVATIKAISGFDRDAIDATLVELGGAE